MMNVVDNQPIARIKGGQRGHVSLLSVVTELWMDLLSTPQIHVWGRRHGNGERWGSETRLLVSGAAPCMPTSRVLQRPAGQVEELNLNGHTDLVVVNPSTRLYFGFVLVFVFRCR